MKFEALRDLLLPSLVVFIIALGICVLVQSQQTAPQTPIIAVVHDPVLVPSAPVHKRATRPAPGSSSSATDEASAAVSLNIVPILSYLDTKEKDVTETGESEPLMRDDCADVLAEIAVLRMKLQDPNITYSEIEDAVNQLHADVEALYQKENEDIA